MERTQTNILTLFVALFVIYYLQGVLYPSGSLVSQIVISLFLLIGFVYYVKTVLYVHKPYFVTVWLVLYFIQVITFIFSPKEVFGTLYEAIGRVSTMEQIKGISAFMLSFCVGYVVARKGGKEKISDNYLMYLGIVLFVLAFVRYFYLMNRLRTTLEIDEVTNSSGYFFVKCLPFFPFILKRSRILTLIIWVLSIALVMFSAKRGAIVCMVASLLFSILFYMKQNKASVKSFLLAVVMFAVAGYFLYYAYESSEWLLTRIETMQDEGIGGRGIAYTTLFNHWYNDTNFWTLMFGNGMAQTVTVWGNFAHNDWLELLICNGLVGVGLYLTIFIGIFRFIYKSSLPPTARLAAYLCMLVWFLQSLFSMGYTAVSSAEYILLLGLLVGSEKVRVKKVTYNNG